MLLYSLVPRPSAASFLLAYVTFEPPSDKLAEGLVPLLCHLQAKWTRFHVKWLRARSSRANGVIVDFYATVVDRWRRQVWNSLLYGCSSLDNYNSLPLH